MTLRPRLLALLVALAVGAASGQTLARKGWVGSGITVEPWWEGAVLYQIDPLRFQDSQDDGSGDLKGITQRLDYLQGLHVDAIVLSPFQLQAELGKTAGPPAFDPKYGSEENLDQLLQEAGRRKMRLFVDVPVDSSHTTQQNLDAARFWLSRGVAGLRLTDATHETPLPQAVLADRLKQLQTLCATYAGQRVLLWDLPETMPVLSATRQRHGARTGVVAATQMTVDRRLLAMTALTTDGLRLALAAAGTTETTRVPVTDTGDHARSWDRYGDGSKVQDAKLLATALLTSGGAPMLYFGQELGMATTDANLALEDADADSLLNWYRRLSALQHENAALHSGSMRLIAETNPDIVAWVRTPASGGAVVVVCNVTGRTLRVSVAAEVHKLGIETGPGMMRTLTSTEVAATGSASGAVSMNGIELAPFGLYIGELPRPLGLESAPSVPRRSPR